MTELVSISNSALRVTVSALGAELVRLQDSDGRDLLWDGDPAFWTGRAPLLFPLVGAVKDNRIRIGGVEYRMPRHGFARTSHFVLVSATLTSCTWRLQANDETRRQYPFEFCLDVTHAIDGGALYLTAEVTNQGGVPLPASFGFHPALRWPLPYGLSRQAHEIVFERDEPAPIRRLAHDLLSPVLHPTPVRGHRLHLHDDLFRDDAIVFDRLQSRSLVYGEALRVSFPEMPYLGIWSKPGAGFVCIEPWQGYASPAGFDGELADKPGVLQIPPGGTKRFEMSISVVLPGS